MFFGNLDPVARRVLNGSQLYYFFNTIIPATGVFSFGSVGQLTKSSLRLTLRQSSSQFRDVEAGSEMGRPAQGHTAAQCQGSAGETNSAPSGSAVREGPLSPH